MAFPLTRLARAGALALVLATALVAALPAPPTGAADEGPALTGVVNVNTATAAELQLLPGIGEARALAVIELRKSRGGFKAVDELLDVSGIGETSLERMRAHVVLTGKTTARVE